MNIVDLAIKSIVVTLLGMCVLLVARRGSAATRHFALALSLFSLCALPFVAPLVPAWSVPFLTLRVPARVRAPVQTQSFTPALQAPAMAAPISVSPEVAVPVHIDRDTALLLVWASIATLFGLRLFTRYSRLRRLERSLPMFAQPELQSIVADYCRRHARHFLLLEGESNEPPMTWGHSRPVLLLPSAAREWPQDRLRSVMLHEMAHVERGDWIVSLASEIVCALFWFNPLVWVIRKQLEIESELAADERVLSSGVAPTQYATHLVELLRDLNRFPKAADAAVGMTRPSRLDGRIKAILQPKLSSRPLRGAAHIGFIAIVSAIVVLVGAAGPTLVHERAAATPSTQSDNSPTIVVTSRPIQNPAPSRRSESTTDDPLWTPQDEVRAPASSHAAKLPKRSPSRMHNVESASLSAVSPDHTKDLGVSSAIASALAKPVGSTVADDGNADNADWTEAGFDSKEMQVELKQAGDDARRGFEEARREAAKSGVKLSVDAMKVVANIDLPGILDVALKSAGEGLKQAHLSKHQRDAINAQIQKSLRETAKFTSPPLPDTND